MNFIIREDVPPKSEDPDLERAIYLSLSAVNNHQPEYYFENTSLNQEYQEQDQINKKQKNK